MSSPKTRHGAGSLDTVFERHLDKEGHAHALARGVCPSPGCPGRPLRLVSTDGQRALVGCSCGFSTVVGRATKLFRMLRAGEQRLPAVYLTPAPAEPAPAATAQEPLPRSAS